MSKDKKENKQEILINITDFIDKSDFEGTIEEVAERITSIPKRFLEKYPYRNDIKTHIDFLFIKTSNEIMGIAVVTMFIT
jgi:hypothetical protein